MKPVSILNITGKEIAIESIHHFCWGAENISISIMVFFTSPLTERDMDSINVKTYWEKIAESKWGQYTSTLEKNAILMANNMSNTPKIAFELGCEGGRWANLLTKHGWKLICADVDKDTLTLCKQRLPEALCMLVSSNSNSIHLENESISLLLCIEVAPVINSGWFGREAFRVIEKGGLVVGVFWNLLSFRGLFCRTRMAMDPTSTLNFYEFSYPLWKNRFLNNGFSMIYEEGFCWFPFGRNSNSNLIPWFTRFEKWSGLRKIHGISPWIIFIAKKGT